MQVRAFTVVLLYAFLLGCGGGGGGSGTVSAPPPEDSPSAPLPTVNIVLKDVSATKAGGNEPLPLDGAVNP